MPSLPKLGSKPLLPKTPLLPKRARLKALAERAKAKLLARKLTRKAVKASKAPKAKKAFKTQKQQVTELIQAEHQSPRRKVGQEKIIKVHSKEFAALQAKWYAKLAADTSHPDGNFKDIEWQTNPDSPHLKKPSSRARKLVPGKQLYYALARNFATHGTFKTPTAKKAWDMHSEGISYRRILKAVKKSPWKYKKSLYAFYYFIEAIRQQCMRFNTDHPEGLFYGQDSFADDSLLMDFTLETAIDADTDAYDLPMDAGHWQNIRPRRD